MSDFLNNLIARSLGTEPVIQPRLPSRFEPAMPYAGSFSETSTDWYSGPDEPAEEPTLQQDRAAPQPSDKQVPLASAGGQATASISSRAEGLRFDTDAPDRVPPESSRGIPHFRGSNRPDAAVRQRETAEKADNDQAARSFPIKEQISSDNALSGGTPRQEPLVQEPFRTFTAKYEPGRHGSKNPAESVAEENFPEIPPTLETKSSRISPYNKSATIGSSESVGHKSERGDSSDEPAITGVVRESVATMPDLFPAPSHRKEHEAPEQAARPLAVTPSDLVSRMFVEPERTQRPQVTRPGATAIEHSATSRFSRNIPPAPPGNPPEPSIQVTIGRIEVRAVSPQTPRPREKAASPVMSLNDYLERRSKRRGV